MQFGICWNRLALGESTISKTVTRKTRETLLTSLWMPWSSSGITSGFSSGGVSVPSFSGDENWPSGNARRPSPATPTRPAFSIPAATLTPSVEPPPFTLAPVLEKLDMRFEMSGPVNVSALGLSRLPGPVRVADGGPLNVEPMLANKGLFSECCVDPLGEWAYVKD